MDRLHRLAEDAGRDPASLRVMWFTLWWGTEPGEPLRPAEASAPFPGGDRRLLSGGTQRMKDDMAEMEGIGVDSVIVNFERETVEDTLEGMEVYAAEFIGSGTGL